MTNVGVPKQLHLMLNAKAKRGRMDGYAFQIKGYRMWIQKSDKIIETKNVSLNEQVLTHQKVKLHRAGLQFW